MMIEIREVSRRYGARWALQDISLTIEKNCVLGLLGQNGAGKTTLLNVLTGFLAPSTGQVLVDGESVLLNPLAAKEKIGYLPELPPLYDEMTVREYLCFVSGLRRVVPKAAEAHTDEIMHMTGLWEVRDRVLGHLSKGYRQRAGFAQALCGDSEVLVLDEPTVGLDPKQITEIRQLIRTLAPGRTIVFSSHILSEVEQLCDRVVILHEGRIRLDSTLAGLGQSGSEVTLRVSLWGGETSMLSAVRQLEGLKHAETLPAEFPDACSLRLCFSGDPQPEKRLFSLCAGRGISILALRREGGSLEQVFLDVISGKEKN